MPLRHVTLVVLAVLSVLAAGPGAATARADRVTWIAGVRADPSTAVFRLPALRPEAVVSATLVSGRVREAVARTALRRAAARRVLRLRRPGRGLPRRPRLKLVLDTGAPRTRVVGGPPSADGVVSFRFAADEKGVTFRCRLDRGPWTPCTSPGSYSALSKGRHTFAVRATDRAGNTDPTPATVVWTVAVSTPPVRSPIPLPAPSPAHRPPAPAPVPAVTPPTLSDAEAAARVRRSGWEPRPDNAVANHRVPTADGLAAYRRARGAGWCNRADLRVTGDFTGTTDEILQWAAWKWGLSADLVRAVAVTESWWRQSAVDDHVDGEPESFGLLQVRVTVHHGTAPLAQQSTAFNADYYGAIIRYYLDGCASWLNDVERGEQYAAGDLWGSVGAWYAGRWHTGPAEDYIATVKRHLHERTWAQPGF